MWHLHRDSGYWVGCRICFFLTYERRLPDALFLGSKKLPLSEDIVKSEAIVDARWVRNMYSPAHSVPHHDGVWCAPDYLHIYILRGVLLPLLVLLYRAVVGLLERNEQG